jgi:MYXO-CTERM domain-containing protein
VKAVLAAALALAPVSALAQRPDTGAGLFHYDDTDVLAFVDGPGGIVRVHYSVSGPNATILDDDDASGFPDFPEEVAATAEDVLTTYEVLGFWAPLTEADVGLGDLGGSAAFDFYLVDFGGSADGNFSTDRCQDGVCAGFMIMENDFRGYGYPSLSAAIRVLTSHELFHAVQNAYSGALPVWMSEGTAVWAEKVYDDASLDFLGFADAYLADTGRSIDRPPAAPVPAFAYGTCLFWEFLSLRRGDGALVDLLEETAALDGLDAVEAAIEDAGGTLSDEWIAFTEANLATGEHAGLADFYPFAAQVDAVAATAEGTAIEDDERFYPLAASYYFLSHPGGELFFATADDPTGLIFSLHPVPAGGPESPTDEAVATFEPEGPGTTSLGNLPAGDYWLRGTYPERATESVHILFCVGRESDLADCLPPAPPDAGAPDAGDVDAGPPPRDESSDDGGCSCRTTPDRAAPVALAAGALLIRRRRRGGGACEGGGAGSG